MNAPAPGIYREVPEATYRAWPLLSQSTLKVGRKSMLHLRHAMTTPREPTPAMELGTALHTAFLQPEEMLDKITVYRSRRQGAVWEAFKAANAHKIILYPADYDCLQGMIRSVRNHPLVRDWTSRMEGVEVSAVGEIGGVPMKGRADGLTSDPLADLKKCSARSFEPRDFERQAYTLGYHIQAFVYCQLFQRERFIFVAVEEEPPHDVIVYEVTPELMRIGQQETLALLQQYQQCVESGRWPGVSDEVVGLDAPAWVAAQQSEPITFDGEEVTL